MTNTSISAVSMIGLGYIGLPTAAVMARAGLRVLGVDVRPEVVETVNRGDIHIVEPRLEEIVRAAVRDGRLSASGAPEPADAFLIAVPTPVTPDRRADLSMVFAAADSIAPVLKAGDLVVLESTSPMGTTQQLIDRLAKARPDLLFPAPDGDAAHEVHVAYCPERVLPGNMVAELVANHRAIGGACPCCADRAAALYGAFVEGELVPTTMEAAELCKLAENAFRDVNIAFANELANVCERRGVDEREVIALANRHPRVSILKPGTGVGGHCIAVDPWFIAEAAPEDTPLIQAARAVNDGRPGRVASRIAAAAAAFQREHGRAPAVACLGLAYKPDVDDLRESPAIEAVELTAEALGAGAVTVAEPHAPDLPAPLGKLGVRQAEMEEAVRAADIVVFLVAHAAFDALPDDLLESRLMLDPCGYLQGRRARLG